MVSLSNYGNLLERTANNKLWTRPAQRSEAYFSNLGLIRCLLFGRSVRVWCNTRRFHTSELSTLTSAPQTDCLIFGATTQYLTQIRNIKIRLDPGFDLWWFTTYRVPAKAVNRVLVVLQFGYYFHLLTLDIHNHNSSMLIALSEMNCIDLIVKSQHWFNNKLTRLRLYMYWCTISPEWWVYSLENISRDR